MLPDPLAEAAQNPFPGPRPFEEGQTRTFFGRSQEISRLASVLSVEACTLLFARSGAGKTSLVKAGLMRHLKAKGWRILVGRVSDQAVGAGPRTLPTSDEGRQNRYVGNLLTHLGAHNPSPSLIKGLADLWPEPEASSRSNPRLLIIDQFEELFTSNPELRPQRTEFFDQIRLSCDGSPDYILPSDILDASFLDRALAGKGIRREVAALIQSGIRGRKGESREAGIAASISNLLSEEMLLETVESDKEEGRQILQEAEMRYLQALGSGRGKCVRLARHALEVLFPRTFNPVVEPNPDLHILFSMREDHIGQLEPYLSCLPGRLLGRVRIEPLSEHAAREALVCPFRHTRVRPPSRSSRQIVSLLQNAEDGQASGHGFVDPLLLQIVGHRLWEDCRRRRFSGSSETEGVPSGFDSQDASAVENVLSEYYELRICEALAAYNALPALGVSRSREVSEGELRDWFSTRLIQGNRRVRWAKTEPEIAGIPTKLVELLERGNILRKEDLGLESYELVHDRFITTILEANRRWFASRGTVVARQNQLLEAARAAELGGPLITSATDLEAAEEHIRNSGEIGVGDLVRRYVAASRAEFDRARARVEMEARQAEADARAREAEAKLEAETERSKAKEAELALLAAQEQSAREASERAQKESDAKARRTWRYSVLLGVLAITALSFAMQARSAEKRAEAESNQSKERAKDLADQTALAKASEKKANAFLADSRLNELKAKMRQIEVKQSLHKAELEARKAQIAGEQARRAQAAAERNETDAYANSAAALSLLMAGKPESVSLALSAVVLAPASSTGQLALRSSLLFTHPVYFDFGQADYAAISRDGKYVACSRSSTPSAKSPAAQASAGAATRIDLWDGLSGKAIRSIDPGSDLTVEALAFSPDGTELVAVGSRLREGKADEPIAAGVIVDVKTGEERSLRVSDSPQASFFAHLLYVAFASDGKTLFTVGANVQGSETVTGRLDKWDVATGAGEPATIEGREIPWGEIRAASRAGAFAMVVGSQDDATGIGAWTSDGRSLGKIPFANPTAPNAFDISPRGDKLAYVGAKLSEVLVASLGKKKKPLRLRTDGESVSCLGFSPNGRYLLGGTSEGVVRVWRLDNGKLLPQTLRGNAGISDMTFDASGRKVYLLNTAGTCQSFRIDFLEARLGELERIARARPGVKVYSKTELRKRVADLSANVGIAE